MQFHALQCQGAWWSTRFSQLLYCMNSSQENSLYSLCHVESQKLSADPQTIAAVRGMSRFVIGDRPLRLETPLRVSWL